MSKKGFTIEEVICTFLERNRFYATILSKMVKVKTKVVDTLGVGFSNSGVLCLYYNEKFFYNLSLKHQQGVIEHEVLHVFFRHLSRWPMEKYTTGDGFSKHIKKSHENHIINIGLDCAINQFIDSNLPDECMLPEGFDLPRDKSADFYIAELMKKFPKPLVKQTTCPECGGKGFTIEQPGTGKQETHMTGEKEDQDGQGEGEGEEEQGGQGQDGQEGEGEGQGEGEGKQPSCNCGGDCKGNHESCSTCGGQRNQGGMGQTLDTHDMWGKVIDHTGKVMDASDFDIDTEHAVQSAVENSIKECKDFGKLPDFVQRELDKLRSKPRHNWKQELRVFINSVLTVSKRLSQKRVNRRLLNSNFIFPGKKKARKPHLAYARDTSGSMFCDAVQQEIANELEQISKFADVTVIDCDTKVQQYYTFKKATDLRSYLGGGGTSFVPVFELCKKLNVDGLVYATDTWGDFPEKSNAGKFGTNTIWLTFDQKTVDIPFGKHVNISPEDFNRNND